MSKQLIPVTVELTVDEIEHLRSAVSKYTDKNQCHESWKSTEAENMEIKTIAACILAEYKHNV